MSNLVSLKFEVVGRVQGVFFRKYAIQQARLLGLVGWIRNTANNSVEGEAQGESAAIQSMKKWLRETGSPQSKIDEVYFNESAIDEVSYDTFQVRHN